MSEVILDFSAEKTFRIKTRKGDTVLRQPVPAEYFTYLNKIKEKSEEDAEVLYELYIEYFVSLDGEEEKLRSLQLFELFEVAKLVNQGELEKK